ncbi:hypothetical protein DICPUDRAFT_157767 [Dictyostelium purpureum]|uniref:MOSC domain-containing protein n=1 Tax=Dictyostelium purpureum TaxID=5786 RepID=F0ZZY1_DICPU|nr:uncharacterized protein DICPUDRAFT_157767 [Dictyostelium purpureum]EGC30506.1 hypothetical protein DICPUDRAFT_157767 [Dictyostelium purpureum]|eukprot:XP_003292979.1 hypothetical protein DICPUDRAFT_157767 [Dictyostelium purpureum]
MSNWIKDHKSLIATGVLSTAAITLLLKYMSGPSKQLNKFGGITLEKILVYPIKSCGPIELKSCKLSPFGLENDRRFMLINRKENRYVNQKVYPMMSTIKCKYSQDGKYLIVSKEGLEDLRISLEPLDAADIDPSRVYKEVKMFDNISQVYDQGDEQSEWFAKALGNPDIRFTQMMPVGEYNRNIRVHMAESIDASNIARFKNSLSNSCHIMFLSQATIDDVNVRIEKTRKEKGETSQAPLTWDRYRPNFVFSGCTPYQEDDWSSYTLGGEVDFQVADYNGRCPIVTVQQDTGVLDPFGDDEPLRTLRTYRLSKCKAGEKTLLGQYIVVHENMIGKTVNIGDQLTNLKNGFESKYFTKVNFEK